MNSPFVVLALPVFVPVRGSSLLSQREERASAGGRGAGAALHRLTPGLRPPLSRHRALPPPCRPAAAHGCGRRAPPRPRDRPDTAACGAAGPRCHGAPPRPRRRGSCLAGRPRCGPRSRLTAACARPLPAVLPSCMYGVETKTETAGCTLGELWCAMERAHVSGVQGRLPAAVRTLVWRSISNSPEGIGVYSVPSASTSTEGLVRPQ